MNNIKFTASNFLTIFDTFKIITIAVVCREVINFLINVYIHLGLENLMAETRYRFLITNEGIDKPETTGNSRGESMKRIVSTFDGASKNI